MYKIYLITNLYNLKKYIGITKFSIEERFAQHIKRGFLLTEAIKKYGKEMFSIELIEEVESSERTYELEMFYIKEYNTKAPNGYNLTDGGDGIFGWNITDEYREQCSSRVKELHKNKKVGMYGKKHTDETKKKMSDSSKGNQNCLGRVLSDETKLKISESNRGKVLSDLAKKKISENHHDVSGEKNPMYGRKHSPETIEKIRQKALSRKKK
jgi:group I intron endonuclease